MNPLLLVGLGAAAMYYLDPEQGARRRAQAREQLNRAQSAIRQRASGGVPAEAEGQQPSETPEGAHHLGR
jgi:hypothetical protein